jgi:hypothetical protein
MLNNLLIILGIALVIAAPAIIWIWKNGEDD